MCSGDTLGGIGSAIAIKPGSFKQNGDGTFGGTLITQPDRGFNVFVLSLCGGSQPSDIL